MTPTETPAATGEATGSGADTASADAGRELEAAAHEAATAPSVTPDAADAPVAPEGPTGPVAAPAARSRAWVGVLVVCVVVAALVGVNAVLFRRVQAAQDAADRAALVASTQAELTARLDDLNGRLAGIDAAQGDAADRLTTSTRDVTKLRTCVNDAIDAMAKSISSGKPTTVTKC